MVVYIALVISYIVKHIIYWTILFFEILAVFGCSRYLLLRVGFL